LVSFPRKVYITGRQGKEVLLEKGRTTTPPPTPVIELRAPSDNKENTTPFHGEGDSDPEWNSSCDRASISNLTYPP